MDKDEILRKAERGEELTIEEVMEYEKLVKPVEHKYGKYGTLAKIYLQEHKKGTYWALAGDLPEYLHGVDRRAEQMFEDMYASLSKKEEYQKTGEYLTDLRRETEMRKIIDEVILNEVVYV